MSAGQTRRRPGRDGLADMDLMDWADPTAFDRAELSRRPGPIWRVPAFLDSAEGRPLDPDPTGADAATAGELLALEHPLSTSETRWAPSAVARLLLTWSPPWGGAAASDPQRLLVVLRALVCHVHAEDQVPRRLTLRSTAVIEALGEEFVERIHWGGGSVFLSRGSGRGSRQEVRLRELACQVGGGQALLDLESDPLPDEPLSLASVPDDLTGLVLELETLIDQALAQRWEPELLAGCRRALAQLAETRPHVLRRRASVLNTAIGIAWAVGTGNGVVGASPASWSGKELAEAFGATGTSSRGHTILEALGGRHRYGERPSLGCARLMTGQSRSRLVEERDQLLAVLHERGVAVCARDLDDLPGLRW